MSTRRLRRAAARANGQKSAGPVTPAPVAAVHVTGHGLAPGRLAASVCLTIENRAEFMQMHQTLLVEFAPATLTEHLLVEEMAVARWRQQRAWTIETYLLENQMDKMTADVEQEYVSIHEATRLTLAFRDLAEKSPTLQLLQRYESRLSRQFERCRKQLKAVRATNPMETPELRNVPIEPNPTNGRCPAPAEHAESAPETTQPVPIVHLIHPSAGAPPQSAPAMAEFHHGPQHHDPPASPAPEGDLPRAA